MPTLAEKNKFNFNPKAADKINETMKRWLEILPAIDIVINILNIKLRTSGKQNRLYFLKGRTGSGKSTYMIQELYKRIIEKFDDRTSIFCTQPRVVLTKSNSSELIRYNKEWKFGQNIGVRNGSEKINIRSKHGIVYCTTQIMGNLLTELLMMNDKERQLKTMRGMKIIVIDECHVLDTPMMALLKIVYDVVNKFGDLYDCPLFIFSSATIDIENMMRYYLREEAEDVIMDPLMSCDIQGTPNHPVEERFLTSDELKELNVKEQEKRESAFSLLAEYFGKNCLKLIKESKSEIKINGETTKCRDALIFVPLFSAIDFIGDELKKYVDVPYFKIGKGCRFKDVKAWRDEHRNEERVLFVGYGRNYSTASDIILINAYDWDEEARKNEMKIICSTSVIETGKTISTLYLCVNMGIETLSLYNPLSYRPEFSIQYLKQVPINKNQAIQRKGRVGRECPGFFIHFYSKLCYDSFRNNDIPETINSPYLSQMVLNDLATFPIGTYKDLFNLNNYYYPTSTDILINSGRDLFYGCCITQFGQFIMMNSVQKTENWVMYAKYLFYCAGWSLWEALLFASINRTSLPPMLVMYGIKSTTLRYQLKDINEEMVNDDICDSIMRARNMMTSILYGKDKSFKCSKERIYGTLVREKGEKQFDKKENKVLTKLIVILSVIFLLSLGLRYLIKATIVGDVYAVTISLTQVICVSALVGLLVIFFTYVIRKLILFK